MLFRTEEDEDQVTQTTSSQAKETQLIARVTPPHVRPNEEEDKPGMFKRVIIRVLRANFPRHPNSENHVQKEPVFDLPRPWGCKSTSYLLKEKYTF
jgi:hypothetical protein